MEINEQAYSILIPLSEYNELIRVKHLVGATNIKENKYFFELFLDAQEKWIRDTQQFEESAIVTMMKNARESDAYEYFVVKKSV